MLTRREACEKLGVSWFSIRNIEVGQRTPGKELAKKMADLYNCDLIEMLGI